MEWRKSEYWEYRKWVLVDKEGKFYKSHWFSGKYTTIVKYAGSFEEVKLFPPDEAADYIQELAEEGYKFEMRPWDIIINPQNSPRKTFTQEDLEKAMDLGMNLRQNQLSGDSDKSGKQVLQEEFNL